MSWGYLLGQIQGFCLVPVGNFNIFFVAYIPKGLVLGSGSGIVLCIV